MEAPYSWPNTPNMLAYKAGPAHAMKKIACVSLVRGCLSAYTETGVYFLQPARAHMDIQYRCRAALGRLGLELCLGLVLVLGLRLGLIISVE